MRGNLPAAVSRPALLRGRCPQLLRPRLPVPRDFLRAACATGWSSQGQEAEARRSSGGGRGGRGMCAPGAQLRFQKHLPTMMSRLTESSPLSIIYNMHSSQLH